jgi:predicted Zn-dependent protease
MDEESETFLEDIIEKLAKALNYNKKIPVYISSSPVLNAFATQRGEIVINAGALVNCSDVCELIAILAHEVGHIAGNHITTFLAIQPDIVRGGLVVMLIGAVASVFARDPSPLVTGIFGGQHMMHNMAAAKLRQKENMADSKSAEAVKKLGLPIFKSFVSIHEKLGNGIPTYSEYESTHPLSKDRVAKFRRLYDEEKKKKFDNEKLQFIKTLQNKFELIQTKMKALIFNPDYVLTLYFNPKNDIEKYAKAIALYRNNKFEESEKLIDELLNNKQEIFNPANLTEIKSMCLIQRGKLPDAAKIAYQHLKGREIHRDLSFIYAHAIIEGELDKSQVKQAIKIVNKVKIKYDDLSCTILLGKLCSMNGEEDRASLCAAEFASAIGDEEDAKIHAQKALKSSNKFVRRKAQDIVSSIHDKSEAKE